MKTKLPELELVIPGILSAVVLMVAVVLFAIESMENKKDADRFTICPLCGEKEPVPKKVTYIF